MVDLQEFKAWLVRRGLTERSASDVCSRLRRLQGLVDISRVKTAADYRATLARSDSLNPMTTSVRSQLRRAGALFVEFKTWGRS